MTLTAFCLRRDVIDLLALCNDTVMTRRADVCNNRIQVIKVGPGKVIKFDDMTIRTVPAGGHVIRALSRTDVSVVTRRAVVSYTRVVKDRTGKVIKFDDVTNSAILVNRVGRYVINRLACSDHTVVAARAAVKHPAMIIEPCRKGAWGVAIFAIVTI